MKDIKVFTKLAGNIKRMWQLSCTGDKVFFNRKIEKKLFSGLNISKASKINMQDYSEKFSKNNLKPYNEWEKN